MKPMAETAAGATVRSRARVVEGEEYRPPYRAAAVAGVAVWLLYLITLAPTTAFWDTSEYIATAHILGIPHPPGNPTFVVLAKAWDLLLSFTGLPTAQRINLFSATMSALAHACWFLVVHRILSVLSPSRIVRLAGASAAVLISATAFTVWNQSDVNEKVYTVSLFTIGLLSWLAFHWRDNLGRGKDDNLILLMVFILALSVGNHLMSFLAAPALVVFILIVRPRTFMNWKLWAGALVVIALGLSIHLFLPIRAAMGPVINEADPSTWQALWDSLLRKQYDKPSMFMNPLDPGVPRDIGLLVWQIGNYLQYFDWQWARSIAGTISWFGLPRPVFTLIFGALGVYGAIAHYRRDKVSWWYLFLLFLTVSAGLMFYLNFKYGYTVPAEGVTIDMREVRERDYFFLCSFSVWGLWAGIGLTALWQRLSRGVPGDERRSLMFSSPVLVLAFVPLLLNWSWASRRGDYVARDWAYNLLQSVEPYGVLFTNGDNDTFPLWYLQEVEGVRKDVTVIVTSYLNTNWYVRQLRDLTTPCKNGQDPNSDPTRIICQRPYIPDARTPFYASLAKAPTKPITSLTNADIDRIANTPPFQTQQSLTFKAHNLESTIPQGRVMLPADLFMTAILTEALGDRPIYYATTTQTFEDLNLGHFLIRQGVAFKLSDGPVQPNATIVAMPTESPYAAVTGPYLDLPRTDALVWRVFAHSNGFPESRKHWVDKATQGIPWYYAYTHIAAAQAHAVLGQSAEVQRHMARAEVWMALENR